MHISNYLKIFIQVRNNIELQISLTGLIMLFKNIIDTLAVTKLPTWKLIMGITNHCI